MSLTRKYCRRMMNSLRWAILIVIITVTPSGQTPASDQPTYQQARQAYESGEYLLADSIWRQRAEAGNPESMVALGLLLYEGPGGYPANLAESSEWYLRAARLGHAGAQYNLGNAYQKGQGVLQDDEQAAHWWQKAAIQGLPAAAYKLGNASMYGRGLPEDVDQAIKWLKFAASWGHPDARKLLKAWNLDIPPIAYAVDEESGGTTPGLAVKDNMPADTRTVKPAISQVPVVEEPENIGEAPRANATSESIVKITPIANVMATTYKPGPEVKSTAPVEQKSLVSPDAERVDSESRILDIPKEHFTLQLTAMSRPDLVDAYIRLHGITGDLYRYRVKRDSGILYGLSIGKFKSREDAIAFRDQLEQGRRNTHDWQTPWLRRFADVQNLIQAPE